MSEYKCPQCGAAYAAEKPWPCPVCSCGSELVSSGGSVRQSLAWPVGKFTVHDMPDEHEPCYLVCPDGLMIPFNAHATNGVDQARAQWFADALNAALNDKGEIPT